MVEYKIFSSSFFPSVQFIGCCKFCFLIFCKDLMSRTGICILIMLRRSVNYTIICSEFLSILKVKDTFSNYKSCLLAFYGKTKHSSVVSLSVCSAKISYWWPVYWSHSSASCLCMHIKQCQLCCCDFLPCSISVHTLIYAIVTILHSRCAICSIVIIIKHLLCTNDW